MKEAIKGIIIVIVIVEIIILMFTMLLGLIGAFMANQGLCFKRYNFDDLTGHSASLQNYVVIRADGNYTSNTITDGVRATSNAGYGKWVKADILVDENQELKFKISGMVSLCRGYLPPNNIQSLNNLDANNKKIPIPRVESTSPALTLFFSATTPEWRNVAEVYRGDGLEVVLEKNRNPTDNPNITTISEIDGITNNVTIADCTEGKRTYSPLCGRWSLWNGGAANNAAMAALEASYTSKMQSAQDKQTAMTTATTEMDTLLQAYAQNITDYQTSLSAPAPAPDSAAPAPPTPINWNALNSTDRVNVQNYVNGTTTGNWPIYKSSLYRATQTLNFNTSMGNSTTAAVQSINTKYQSIQTLDTERKQFLAEAASIQAQISNNNTGNATYYIKRCVWNRCAWTHEECNDDLFGCGNCGQVCDAGYLPERSIMPDPYLDNGTLTIPRFTGASDYLKDWNNINCNAIGSAGALSTVGLITRFWFSADTATGLQYRFDTRVNPTNAMMKGVENTAKDMPAGSGYKWAALIAPDDEAFQDQYTGRKIYSKDYAESNISYLQYRFHGQDNCASCYNSHTGGYVMRIKQTKCKRIDGSSNNDSYPDRGRVKYLIAMPEQDPNKDATLANGAVDLAFNAGHEANVNTGTKKGYIWFKINNKPEDYVESDGSYKLDIYTVQKFEAFISVVLNPVFNFIRGKITGAAQTVFGNMICYKQTPTSTCTNLFNYIKAILTLYIMVYGMMFLLGSAKITHKDLVIRVIKVSLVAGLISGKTFEFFNGYIFDFLVHFTDQIITNLGGFSTITAGNKNLNPFIFVDNIMTKIFFNPTFIAQAFAVLGMGLVGLLYFVIVMLALALFVISIMRAIAIYIMAMIAIAFLITLAPIFLTFMLFEQTYYLFEAWYKIMFKHMMEPVILIAGLIVLTQLFTLYMDQVLSYSVCWKCAIPFYLPFASMLPFPGLANIPIFCLYWFGPWGLSPQAGEIGMEMANMVGLGIVSITMYGYTELASKISDALMGEAGGSSIKSGAAMSSAIGNKISGFVGNLMKDSLSSIDLKGLGQKAGNSKRGGAGGGGALGGGSDDKSGGDGGKKGLGSRSGGKAGGGNPPPVPPRTGHGGSSSDIYEEPLKVGSGSTNLDSEAAATKHRALSNRPLPPTPGSDTYEEPVKGGGKEGPIYDRGDSKGEPIYDTASNNTKDEAIYDTASNNSKDEPVYDNLDKKGNLKDSPSNNEDSKEDRTDGKKDPIYDKGEGKDEPIYDTASNNSKDETIYDNLDEKGNLKENPSDNKDSKGSPTEPIYDKGDGKDQTIYDNPPESPNNKATKGSAGGAQRTNTTEPIYDNNKVDKPEANYDNLKPRDKDKE